MAWVVLAGSLQGYLGGRFDLFAQRLTELFVDDERLLAFDAVESSVVELDHETGTRVAARDHVLHAPILQAKTARTALEKSAIRPSMIEAARSGMKRSNSVTVIWPRLAVTSGRPAKMTMPMPSSVSSAVPGRGELKR